MEGVSVAIKKGGKYLLIQQPETKPFPLKWMFVSGTTERGEALEATAIREVREEVGLDIQIMKKAAVLVGDYKAKLVHFFLADWRGGAVKADPREIKDFGWFSYEELKKLDLMGATRRFIELHPKALG